MMFWIVETPNPVLKNRNEDNVMDSAVNYRKYAQPKRNYTPLQLMMDSGAYTAARKGWDLDPYWVINVQEKMGADLAVPLDYPLTPGMHVDLMRTRVERTLENVSLWVEHFGARRVIPVVHAVGWEGLHDVLSRISRIAGEAQFVALGCILVSGRLRGFLGDRQPSARNILSLQSALRLAKEEYGFKVHLTGFGSSPLMINLAVYMGADSIDTSGARRRAAYGKILLPGRGERYVGRGDAKFGLTKFTEEDRKLLEECRCPVCRIDPQMLRMSWKARAIHNEYVLKEELSNAVKMAQSDIEAYERYLDRLFARSSLCKVWKKVKMAARSAPLI